MKKFSFYLSACHGIFPVLWCILMLFTFYFLPLNLFAQQPTLEWWTRYYRGNNSGFWGPFIGTDRIGNCYINGFTTIGSGDSSYALTIKYNSSGVQQWVTLYRHPGWNIFLPYGAVVDSNGYVYAIYNGGFSSFGNWNCLTIKFAPSNGAVLWAKTYNAPFGGSDPLDITVDSLGNSYVVGVSDSALLCIKYNPNGDSLWVRRYSNPPPYNGSVAYSCVLDDSLNLLATGFIRGASGFDGNMITIKYSSNGVFRWSSIYNREPYDRTDIGRAIDVDTSGNVYVTGTSLDLYYQANFTTIKYNPNGIQQWVSIYKGPGFGDHVPVAIGVSKRFNYIYVTGYGHGDGTLDDYATIRYDPLNGDSIWVRRFNGTQNYADKPEALALDFKGNVYVTGSGSMTSTSEDYVTIKYIPDGTVSWTAIYNHDSMSDIATGLVLDASSCIFVTGGTWPGSGGRMDYLTLKYSQPVGVEQSMNETPNIFKLYQNYPNPFNQSSIINYQLPIASDVSLKVYDVLGNQVSVLINGKQDAGTYSVIFNASHLASGVYFYKLTADGKIIDTKKFIVLK